jgi:hypothetical protein
MADVNFLKRLQEYDANNIPDAIIKKLKPYVDNKDFQPAVSKFLKLFFFVKFPSLVFNFFFNFHPLQFF